MKTTCDRWSSHSNRFNRSAMADVVFGPRASISSRYPCLNCRFYTPADQVCHTWNASAIAIGQSISSALIARQFCHTYANHEAYANLIFGQHFHSYLFLFSSLHRSFVLEWSWLWIVLRMSHHPTLLSVMDCPLRVIRQEKCDIRLLGPHSTERYALWW